MIVMIFFVVLLIDVIALYLMVFTGVDDALVSFAVGVSYVILLIMRALM